MTGVQEHSSGDVDTHIDTRTLRRGWTTGACATGAVVACAQAFLTQKAVKAVSPKLPHDSPKFEVINLRFDTLGATATIIKDAGDDPDITHLAKITAHLQPNDTGIEFKAGLGVGTVTKKGLPIAVGQASINPKPREMIIENLIRVTGHCNWTVEISIENGEELAKKTWNPRLGIVGGLSVLGTTGVVIPYSCSSWIHSIHRGVDVAIADGIEHLVGSTGKTSERVAMETLKLDPQSYLDMGDFVGGMLKYITKNRVPKVTISGGFAKIVKLAQGARDLHSSRSQVDFIKLADMLSVIGATEKQIIATKNANTAMEVLEDIVTGSTRDVLIKAIAFSAKNTAMAIIGSGVEIEMLIINRLGDILYYDGAK